MFDGLFKPFLPAFSKLGIPFAEAGEGGGGGAGGGAGAAGGGTGGTGEGGDGGDDGGDEAGGSKGKKGGIPYARFAEVNTKLSDITDQLTASEEARQTLQAKYDEIDRRLAGLAGPQPQPSGLDPALEVELDRREAALTAKMDQKQADQWANARPESTEDPDYQANFSYMMRKVVEKYGLNIKENPGGVVKLAYDHYRQVWDEMKAAKKGGAGGSGDRGAGAGAGGGGRRVGREALTPLIGGGGSNQEPEFTREQLREIAKDPVKYKKMREKIFAAARAGRIES